MHMNKFVHTRGSDYIGWIMSRNRTYWTNWKSAQWDDIAFVRSTPRAFWLSAVTERYKLVFSSTDQPWLIDLKQDPNEINNLFGEKRHTALIRQLTAQLSAYAKQHRDPYADHPRIQSWMKQASALK